MTSLGFENYAEALKIYLAKYREVREPKKSVPREEAGCIDTDHCGCYYENGRLNTFAKERVEPN